MDKSPFVCQPCARLQRDIASEDQHGSPVPAPPSQPRTDDAHVLRRDQGIYNSGFVATTCAFALRTAAVVALPHIALVSCRRQPDGQRMVVKSDLQRTLQAAVAVALPHFPIGACVAASWRAYHRHGRALSARARQTARGRRQEGKQAPRVSTGRDALACFRVRVLSHLRSFCWMRAVPRCTIRRTGTVCTGATSSTAARTPSRPSHAPFAPASSNRDRACGSARQGSTRSAKRACRSSKVRRPSPLLRVFHC